MVTVLEVQKDNNRSSVLQSVLDPVAGASGYFLCPAVFCEREFILKNVSICICCILSCNVLKSKELIIHVSEFVSIFRTLF